MSRRSVLALIWAFNSGAWSMLVIDAIKQGHAGLAAAAVAACLTSLAASITTLARPVVPA